MKKYNSIPRYGKSFTQGAVLGDIVITEKLDGANASFKREGDKILAFSRNTELDSSNNLRGFYEWTQKLNVNNLVNGLIYFGEWTCRHKIDYGENQNKFYLFDIYDEDIEKYYGFTAVEMEALSQDLNLIPVFYNGPFQSLEHIQSFVGQSKIGEVGEGVVVKNYQYEDKSGEQLFVKFVSDEFAEMQQTKKHVIKDDALTEFVKSSVNEARVSKLIHKLVDEGILGEEYDISDMGTILKNLSKTVSDDVIEEEIDELIKIVRKKIGKQIPLIVKEILAKEGRA